VNTTIDGAVGFDTTLGSNLTAGNVGLVLHELTHALGRVSGASTIIGSPIPTIEDLFRFTGTPPNQVRQFVNDPNNVGYFSFDGGVTDSANFDIVTGAPNHDASDFSNLTNDPFNQNAGTSNNLSAFDIKLMNVLGYNLPSAPPTPPQPTGATAAQKEHVEVTVFHLTRNQGPPLPEYSIHWSFNAPGNPPASVIGQTVPILLAGILTESAFVDFFPTTPFTISIQIFDAVTNKQVDINPLPNIKDLTLTLNPATGTWTVPGLVAAPGDRGPEFASPTVADGGESASIGFRVDVTGPPSQVTKKDLIINGVTVTQLTLNGDQLGPNFDDNFIIDTTAAGGLRITVNGDVEEFAPGQVTSLTVDAGGGTNTITLLAPVSFTLNGGNGVTTLVLGAGLPAATYSPDPSGSPDFGTLNIGSAQVQLVGVQDVQNLAPAITGLQLDSTSINENGLAILTGTFTDAGSLSTETVTVNWGDGTTETILQDVSGQRFFVGLHRYLDENPTGTPFGSYTITAMVTNNNNLSASSTTSVMVTDVDPVITSVTSSATASNLATAGQLVTLQGSFTDAGTLDTHTVTVNWEDGTVNSAQVTEAGGSGTFSAQHTFASGGIYPVLITVKDDDTGQATTSTDVYVSGFGIHTFNGVTALQGVGTNQSDTMVVKQHDGTLDVSASFLDGPLSFSTVGLDRIELYGLDGNDTLVVKNTTLPAILVGGNGNDTLVGGDGNNTLIGGAGDNMLFGGKGDTTFIGGAGNDFMHGGPGTNTADFSAQTTSVTINLSTHQATGASIGNDTLISIDNVIGGSADDTFIDGHGEGGDTYSFNGEGGINTAVFHGPSSEYTIVTSLGVDGLLHTAVVDHGAAGDGPVDLVNVQRLQFADETVANMASNAQETFSGGATPQILSGNATRPAPALTVPNGATSKIKSASADAVTFAGNTGTLQLDQSQMFAGTVAGFGGHDKIDLNDIVYSDITTTLDYWMNSNNTGGTLTVSDGTHTANLALLGQYMASSFAMASDGHGGTLISDVAQTSNQPRLAAPHT
jgi:hypothetical protein